MSCRIVRLFVLVGLMLLGGGAYAQETQEPQQPTGSHFPNRFTGRQLVVTAGHGEDRPEYRLLDNGLLFYRKGSDGAFQQLGQHPKDKTMEWFRRAEQELKIKSFTAEQPEHAEASVAWKKGKTEFTAAWENKKEAPEGYRDFYEDFLKLFPKMNK